MGDRLLNAVVGAVATLVLAPLIPLAPVVGGGLAGYLGSADRPDRSVGLRVGALSGAVAVVPLALLAVLFGGLVLGLVTGTMGPAMGPGPMAGSLGGLVLLVVAVVGAVYVVGLSALGGWIGVYLRERL